MRWSWYKDTKEINILEQKKPFIAKCSDKTSNRITVWQKHSLFAVGREEVNALNYRRIQRETDNVADADGPRYYLWVLKFQKRDKVFSLIIIYFKTMTELVQEKCLWQGKV